jgi:hypothetical protein
VKLLTEKNKIVNGTARVSTSLSQLSSATESFAPKATLWVGRANSGGGWWCCDARKVAGRSPPLGSKSGKREGPVCARPSSRFANCSNQSINQLINRAYRDLEATLAKSKSAQQKAPGLSKKP